MSRITIVDVRVAMKAYIKQLQTMGYPVDGLVFQAGGGGRAWALTTADHFAAPGVVGHGMVNGYIGKTAAEAYATLQTTTKAMEFATTWSVENHDRVTR